MMWKEEGVEQQCDGGVVYSPTTRRRRRRRGGCVDGRGERMGSMSCFSNCGTSSLSMLSTATCSTLMKKEFATAHVLSDENNSPPQKKKPFLLKKGLPRQVLSSQSPFFPKRKIFNAPSLTYTSFGQRVGNGSVNHNLENETDTDSVLVEIACDECDSSCSGTQGSVAMVCDVCEFRVCVLCWTRACRLRTEWTCPRCLSEHRVDRRSKLDFSLEKSLTTQTPRTKRILADARSCSKLFSPQHSNGSIHVDFSDDCQEWEIHFNVEQDDGNHALVIAQLVFPTEYPSQSPVLRIVSQEHLVKLIHTLGGVGADGWLCLGQFMHGSSLWSSRIQLAEVLACLYAQLAKALQ
eukprot:m.44960 g.44960  ORF g.44960 m.44960 type:complete len:350 (+) comp7195_c0_seq1:20-1069(+)